MKKHKLMQLAKRQAFLQTGLNIDSTKVSPQKLVRQAHWNYVNAILNKSLEHGNNKPF